MPRRVDKHKEIRKKALDAIGMFFDLDTEQVQTLPREKVEILTMKAKLGMQFEKEMGVAERSSEGKTLRVMTLIAKDRVELKRLLRRSLPQYYP